MDDQTHDSPAESEAALYDHLAALTFSELTESTIESCSALILDHFGCAVLGMTLPWNAALLEGLRVTGRLQRPVQAGGHVYGRAEPVLAMTAVLVNATATHGFDLDDTHLPTMSHPGCIVIPAAVAATELSEPSERFDRDGREFLAAVVTGYEVMGRVAAATGLGFGEKGFHATGQVGPMAAAAAGARLLGLDRDGLSGAVGLAASFGGGIKAFSRGAGMVKRLYAGRAAEAGLFAATLQRSGFTGPPSAVAGPFGFVPTFSTDDAPAYEQLTAGLGEHYVVDDVYIKPYAACGAVHGAVSAAANLVVKAPADVERVVVGTSRRALQQNSIPDPADVMAAQYSTEYSVALALLGGADDPRRYLQVRTGEDQAVRDLARRVVLEVDDTVDRAYPDSNEARVDVWTTDGAHALIVGAYEHPQRLLPDRSVPSVVADVAYGALADAGLGVEAVDGFFYAGVHQGINLTSMADHMGLGPLSYYESTDTGGASYLTHVGHAAMAIAAGKCSVALVAMAGLPRSAPHASPSGVPQAGFEDVYGVAQPPAYALAARRHMHEFGTTSEQLASIRVAASHHAQFNPHALYRTPVTVDEVLESPLVSDPLHRLDCCVTTDGGGAVVVVSSGVARELGRRGVRVLGHGEAVRTPAGGPMDLTVTGAAVSGPRAFAEAGVAPADIDYASIYDSFTITVLLSLEDLGFCEKGKGGGFVEDGALLAPHGALPTNTDGGGLCNNHPDRRGGMIRIIEAVRQLREEAAPKVQVPDCQLAVVQGQGHSLGTRSAAATLVLGREDAR